MTTHIIAVSDTHINSTVGLCPGKINLDDGGTYRPSRSQRWLWECWLDLCQHIKNLDGRKILIHCGDLVELDTRRRSNQIITPNKSTILDMTLNTLEPIVSPVQACLFIRGTMAHTGKSQWAEETIARQYTHALHNKKQDTASWYHFQGAIDWLRLDVAHHASMGGLPWNAPNAANRLAARTLWYYQIRIQENPPHITMRSHNHRWADSGENFEVRAIFLPCFQIITEFGYRIGAELELPDIGAVIISIHDHQYSLHKKFYRPKENKQVWAIHI